MKTYEIQSEIRDPQLTAVMFATLPAEEIGPWLSRTYGIVAGVIGSRGAGPAGPPFACYHRLEAGRLAVEAGFPVSKAIDADGEVHPSRLPGGPVAVTVHIGPYQEMESAYEAVSSWIRDHGGELAGDGWEVYFSDPATQPDPATWRTEIVQPYRPA